MQFAAIHEGMLHYIFASLEHCVWLHVGTGSDHFQHPVRQDEVSQ